MNKRNRIVNEAKKLLKVPFRHNGRTRLGLDCFGLIYLCYNRVFNCDVLSRNDGFSYDITWWNHSTEDRMYNLYKKSGFDNTENPKLGDLILFKFFKSKFSNHSGIYLGNDTFIHVKCSSCSIHSTVSIENITSKYLRRISCYMKYKDIDNNG